MAIQNLQLSIFYYYLLIVFYILVGKFIAILCAFAQIIFSPPGERPVQHLPVYHQDSSISTIPRGRVGKEWRKEFKTKEGSTLFFSFGFQFALSIQLPRCAPKYMSTDLFMPKYLQKHTNTPSPPLRSKSTLLEKNQLYFF